MNQDLIVYLKTTDTCQLNCNHCFTSGKNGVKNLFDVDQTINFFKELKKYVPSYRSGHFSFHGGEPMLCPVDKMTKFYNEVSQLWPNLWWTVQTNLTYKLDEEKINFFKTVCNKSIGTSWDYKIRWANDKQYDLWKENVKTLVAEGVDITVMVSLNKYIIDHKEPIDIIKEISALGIQHINFERLTPNGNALDHLGIFPSNEKLDLWLHKMWKQTEEHKAWEFIDNMFLDSVLTSFVHGKYAGCRSRQCEQKIFTINASGTIGGCPNDATLNHYGSIRDSALDVLYHTKRMCNINKESIRNPVCGTCEVFDICNGDCHQLKWEGDVCAAPKSMMKEFKMKKKNENYQSALNHFMGQE